jgi:hypothetical protein
VVIPPPAGTLTSLVCRRTKSACWEGCCGYSVRHQYLARLLAKPDKGKVFEYISASHLSKHFLRTGTNTRFCDWRFVHRARLGVVPLNASMRWGPRNDLRCRRCGLQSETLPHVLKHCRCIQPGVGECTMRSCTDLPGRFQSKAWKSE